eukprot:g8585.t1
MALVFAILAFATSIASLSHQLGDFDSIDRGMFALLQMTLKMYPTSGYYNIREEPWVLTAVCIFAIAITIFFLMLGGEETDIHTEQDQTSFLRVAYRNLLIAQLNQAYQVVYEDMQGFARLNRASVIVATLLEVSPKRWKRFLTSLRFDERLEFNEGDIGMAGGIQIMEPANDTSAAKGARSLRPVGKADRAHHKEHHWQEKLDSTRLPDGGSSSLGHMEGRWRVLDILGRVLESNERKELELLQQWVARACQVAEPRRVQNPRTALLTRQDSTWTRAGQAGAARGMRSRGTIYVALEGARLAIEARDVAEMHKSLAALLGQGACAKRARTWPRPLRDEVLGFRLLYLAHGGLQGHPGSLTSELVDFLQETDLAEKTECSVFDGRKETSGHAGPCWRFAEALRRAQAAGNWARHLSLAARGPKPTGQAAAALDRSGRLAWTLAAHVRRKSLEVLAKAFPQGVRSGRAAQLLGLQDSDDFEAWNEWNEELLQGETLNTAAVGVCFSKERAAIAQREAHRSLPNEEEELQGFARGEVRKRLSQKDVDMALAKEAVLLMVSFLLEAFFLIKLLHSIHRSAGCACWTILRQICTWPRHCFRMLRKSTTTRLAQEAVADMQVLWSHRFLLAYSFLSLSSLLSIQYNVLLGRHRWMSPAFTWTNVIVYGCLTVYVIFPWLLSRSSLNKCYVVGMLFACAYLSPWHTSSDPCTVSNQEMDAKKREEKKSTAEVQEMLREQQLALAKAKQRKGKDKVDEDEDEEKGDEDEDEEAPKKGARAKAKAKARAKARASAKAKARAKAKAKAKAKAAAKGKTKPSKTKKSKAPEEEEPEEEEPEEEEPEEEEPEEEEENEEDSKGAPEKKRKVKKDVEAPQPKKKAKKNEAVNAPEASEKATFAKRYRPKIEAQAMKWDKKREVYDTAIRPYVNYHSYVEERYQQMK